jgi:hypothetical protein
MTSPDAASADAELATPSPSPPPESKPTYASARPPGRRWILLLGLSLIAGAAAWLAGERTMEYARLSKAAAENYRDSTALNAEMPRVIAINGALTFGTFGGLLGLALGLGGGLCRRSTTGAIVGALAGLILGAAAGALPALAVMPWHWRHRNDDPATLELLTPLLKHMALWSAVGLAAGLAFGIGSSGRPARLLEAALAGLLGAMLGTLAFEILGAVFFPLDHTADPFSSTSSTRLLAKLCVAGFVGLGVVRCLPSRLKDGAALPWA